MVERLVYKKTVESALERGRAVALIGPRQCGKTTLAREFVDADSSNYFDLEDPVDVARLSDPKNALSSLCGLVVIDEVQLCPDLFPVLRVLLDRKPLPAKFLILGSASPDLLKQSSESLAGRLELVEMEGFGLREVGDEAMTDLWTRGGFPLSFLSDNDADSFQWRRSFIRLFLERDIQRHGIEVPVVTLHRFWTMLAHSHGNIWNSAPFASSLGISQPTVRRYLDIMSGLFMVRQIQPWHVNIKKRQVKSPKVYVRDTGILHSLLGIKTESDILTHPCCGASWEGFVIEEIIRTIKPDDFYYWATYQGAEIDLIIFKGAERYGFEIKRSDAPSMTASMHMALETLQLKSITVIYPGSKRYSLADNVMVVPFRDFDKIEIL